MFLCNFFFKIYFIKIRKKQTNNRHKVAADIVSIKTDHDHFQKLNPVLSGLGHNHSQFSHRELMITASFKHIAMLHLCNMPRMLNVNYVRKLISESRS